MRTTDEWIAAYTTGEFVGAHATIRAICAEAEEEIKAERRRAVNAEADVLDQERRLKQLQHEAAELREHNTSLLSRMSQMVQEARKERDAAVKRVEALQQRVKDLEGLGAYSTGLREGFAVAEKDAVGRADWDGTEGVTVRVDFGAAKVELEKRLADVAQPVTVETHECVQELASSGVDPAIVFARAKGEYWGQRRGPCYDQPGGNTYECDAFIARRVFDAGRASVHQHHHDGSEPAPTGRDPVDAGKAAAITETVVRRCSGCEHRDADVTREPCISCYGYSKWTATKTPAVATTPSPEPDREALGRAVYDGMFGMSGLYPQWDLIGQSTRSVCIETGERLYAMGRASRDAGSGSKS